MPNIYLAQWEWTTDAPDDLPLARRSYWRAPGGNPRGTLHMRSSPDAATPIIPRGYSWFVYDAPQSGLALSLGSDIEAQTTRAQRNGMETLLGLPLGSLSATSIRRTIRELLCIHGDPTGQSRFRGVGGDVRNGFQIYLGGFGLIVNEPFNSAHPAWANTIAAYKAGYEVRREDGVTPLDVLRRQTGDQLIRLGLTDPTLILPTRYQGDGALSPRTTIGDTFVEASDTGLDAHTATGPNGGFSWTEVLDTTWQVYGATDYVGKGNNGYGRARADSDLSSANHYAQTVITVKSGTSFCGPCCRYSASADTCYLYETREQNGGSYRLARISAGADTELAVINNDPTPAAPFTLKVDVTSADLITGYFNGSSKLSVTDGSPITGNTRCGVYQYHAAVRQDDFEAADLAAAAVAPKGQFTLLGVGA